MWFPSFYSVLVDLWRFVWPARSSARISYRPAAIGLQDTEQIRPKPKPIVLAVDPVAMRPVELELDTVQTKETPAVVGIRKKLHAYDSHLVKIGNLTLIEWLLYKVHVADDSISLLALAMTPVGRWHQTLKAQPGVRVSIEPTTGSLMEWYTASPAGQAGFIKYVSPDQMITVQSISQNPDGMYREQVLTVNQWKELGPVFTRFRS